MQISVFHHIWMVSAITSSDIYSAPFSILGFRGGSDGKESACNAGDLGLIPGEGRSPGEGHGNLLQYSCLGNPTDRGAWRATATGQDRPLLSENCYTQSSLTLCDPMDCSLPACPVCGISQARILE